MTITTGIPSVSEAIEAEVKRRVELCLSQLRRDLEKAKDEAEMLRWAIKGVLKSDNRIQVRVSPAELARGDVDEVVLRLGNYAGRVFEQRAGIAFKLHREHSRALKHIADLESQLKRNLIEFDRWKPDMRPLEDG